MSHPFRLLAVLFVFVLRSALSEASGECVNLLKSTSMNESKWNLKSTNPISMDQIEISHVSDISDRLTSFATDEKNVFFAIPDGSVLKTFKANNADAAQNTGSLDLKDFTKRHLGFPLNLYLIESPFEFKGHYFQLTAVDDKILLIELFKDKDPEVFDTVYQDPNKADFIIANQNIPVVANERGIFKFTVNNYANRILVEGRINLKTRSAVAQFAQPHEGKAYSGDLMWGEEDKNGEHYVQYLIEHLENAPVNVVVRTLYDRPTHIYLLKNEPTPHEDLENANQLSTYKVDRSKIIYEKEISENEGLPPGWYSMGLASRPTIVYSGNHIYCFFMTWATKAKMRPLRLLNKIQIR